MYNFGTSCEVILKWLSIFFIFFSGVFLQKLQIHPSLPHSLKLEDTCWFMIDEKSNGILFQAHKVVNSAQTSVSFIIDP